MTRGLNKRLCDVGFKNLWTSGSGARPCEATGGQAHHFKFEFQWLGGQWQVHRCKVRDRGGVTTWRGNCLFLSFRLCTQNLGSISSSPTVPIPPHPSPSTAPSRHSSWSDDLSPDNQYLFADSSKWPKYVVISLSCSRALPLYCRKCAPLGGKKSPPRIWPSITFAQHHRRRPRDAHAHF